MKITYLFFFAISSSKVTANGNGETSINSLRGSSSPIQDFINYIKDSNIGEGDTMETFNFAKDEAAAKYIYDDFFDDDDDYYDDPSFVNIKERTMREGDTMEAFNFAKDEAAIKYIYDDFFDDDDDYYDDPSFMKD